MKHFQSGRHTGTLFTRWLLLIRNPCMLDIKHTRIPMTEGTSIKCLSRSCLKLLIFQINTSHGVHRCGTTRRPQARTCWETSTESRSGLNCFTAPEYYRDYWQLQKWAVSSQSALFVRACCRTVWSISITSGSLLPRKYFVFLIPRKQLGYSLQSPHWKYGHLSKEKIVYGLLASSNDLIGCQNS